MKEGYGELDGKRDVVVADVKLEGEEANSIQVLLEIARMSRRE